MKKIMILVLLGSAFLASAQTGNRQKVKLGDHYHGGIVFFVDDSGDRVFIAAPYDQSQGARWGCSGSIIGASGLTDGKSNTAAIVGHCGRNTAAYICDTLTIGGYTDWYLPSQFELNKMYEHADIFRNLSSGVYCSSTEYTFRGNLFNCWNQNFGKQGRQFPWDKNRLYYVRAMRDSAIDSLPEPEGKRAKMVTVPNETFDELTIDKAKAAPNHKETRYRNITNVSAGDVVKYSSPYGEVICGIVAKIEGNNMVIIKTYPSQGFKLEVEENYKNLLKIEF